MRTVALVAPYATPTTARYVEALAKLSGVRSIVISADPASRFAPALRAQVDAFEQVMDCFDAAQLSAALTRATARVGPIDRVFGVLEQLQLAVAEARDRVGIEGMSREVVRRFRDKSVMKAHLRAAGVPCARYARVESNADAERFCREVGFPVIVKPVDGLGARATFRVGDDQALSEALRRTRPSPWNPWQIEEFLSGSEHSYETVTIRGQHIWSSSANYLPGPLTAMENPWIQYCVVLPREDDNTQQFSEINHAALDALGMQTGLSHMEWFTRPDGSMAVNEVGARPPGVNLMPLMSLTHGLDMVAAWVKLMALDTFEAPARQRAAGCAFLRGQGPGSRVTGVRGLDQVYEEVGGWVVSATIPTPGDLRATGYEGEGHIIVAAETTAEVEEALARIVRTVRVELG